MTTDIEMPALQPVTTERRDARSNWAGHGGPRPRLPSSCSRRGRPTRTAALIEAQSVQRAQLPCDLRFGDGFELRGHTVAANGVGGDLYDWVVRPDKTIAFIVADVSGHDLAAALIASACHAYFRTCALNAASLEDLVLAMDRNLRADLTCGRFVTAVLGFIDPGLGETRLFSAGHGLVFLRAHATAGLRRLEPGAPPFGVCEFEPACAAIESLLHGETLYVVTDGWYESVPGRARGMDAALRAVTRSHDEEDDGPATARGGPPEPAFPIARVPRREDDRTIVTLRRIQGSEGVAAVAGRTD